VNNAIKIKECIKEGLSHLLYELEEEQVFKRKLVLTATKSLNHKVTRTLSALRVQRVR